MKQFFNRTRQYIAHADDVWILGRWLRATEEVVTQSQEAAVSTGLEISEKCNLHENKQKYKKFRTKSDDERTSTGRSSEFDISRLLDKFSIFNKW